MLPPTEATASDWLRGKPAPQSCREKRLGTCVCLTRESKKGSRESSGCRERQGVTGVEQVPFPFLPMLKARQSRNFQGTLWGVIWPDTGIWRLAAVLRPQISLISIGQACFILVEGPPGGNLIFFLNLILFGGPCLVFRGYSWVLCLGLGEKGHNAKDKPSFPYPYVSLRPDSLG